jgi:hypothetical protein
MLYEETTLTQLGWTLAIVAAAGEYVAAILPRVLGGGQPLPVPFGTAGNAYGLMFVAALLGEIALLCVSSRAAMRGALGLAAAGYMLLRLFPHDPVLAPVRAHGIAAGAVWGILIGLLAWLLKDRRRNPDLPLWWRWWPRVRLTALYAGAALISVSTLTVLGERLAGLPGSRLDGLAFWAPWATAVLGIGGLMTGLPGWPAVSPALAQGPPRRLVWVQPLDPSRRRHPRPGARRPDVRR